MTLNISGVERETGLSKDVLRMWERRYGFPKPGRDDNGERQYTVADIGKLRAVKRLMDVGLRPGKIMTLSIDELNAMADARTPPRRDAHRAGARARRAHDAQEPRRHVAAAHAGQHADAAGAAEVRAGNDHAAQPGRRRRVDAGRTADLRGASVHRAAAGRAAHRDQCVSAPDRHAEGPAHDVSRASSMAWAC